MAKIQSVRVIRLDDLNRNETVPGWVGMLLQPLNEFMETVVGALRGSISLTDNISGEKVELSFTHDVEQVVAPKSKKKILGVFALYTGGQVMTGFGWRPTDNGQLGITITFAGGAATEADCRLFIWME